VGIFASGVLPVRALFDPSDRKREGLVGHAHRGTASACATLLMSYCALLAEVDAEGSHFAVEVGGHPPGGGFLGLVVG